MKKSLRVLKQINDFVSACITGAAVFVLAGWWMGHIVIAKMTDHLFIVHLN